MPVSRRPRSRSTGALLLILGLVFGAVADPIFALTAVELTRRLEQYADELADNLRKIKATELQKADDECDGAIQLDATTTDAALLDACRALIASHWTKLATEKLKATFETQESSLLDTRADDGAALADLNTALRKRRTDVLAAVEEVAEQEARGLEEMDSGPLNTWLDGTESVKGVADALADAAKTAAFKADEAVIEAFVPRAPADAELIAELEKTRERLLGASEKAYQRRVTCSWVSNLSILTCSPGLLLSGEEPSDVLVEGLPAGKPFTVTATITEQRLASAQQLEDRSQVETIEEDYGACAARPLHTDTVTFTGTETLPVLVEVHTDRVLRPTHGGGSHLRDTPNYWAPVAARLRCGSPPGSKPRKLALVTKGETEKLEVTVQIDGRLSRASIPVDYARWKFESAGFLAGSSVVDEELRTRPDPADSSRVIVDSVREVDNYSIETGALVNFVPQNYQALGIALGFATNQDRAPSIYVGANLRVRTFGQNGLASIGAGYLLKSVTRFPDLEAALDEDRSIAADSPLLQGDERFEEGLALIVSLGFSFGPVGVGGKSATD